MSDIGEMRNTFASSLKTAVEKYISINKNTSHKIQKLLTMVQ
jgi:hypothetical protein